MAAQENHLEVVKVLLEYGANQAITTDVEILISERKWEIHFHLGWIYPFGGSSPTRQR